MGDLFQVRRRFIYVGTPVGAWTIYLHKDGNAIISLNQIASLNSCSLQLWVMNLLAHMLGSLPRNHSRHCLQPCCHPSVCIE